MRPAFSTTNSRQVSPSPDPRPSESESAAAMAVAVAARRLRRCRARHERHPSGGNKSTKPEHEEAHPMRLDGGQEGNRRAREY